MKVYIKVLLLLLLAAGMTWIQYEPKKETPKPVSAIVSKDDELQLGQAFNPVKVKKGDKITVYAFDGSKAWVETQDHMRGLLYFGSIENGRAILEREDMQAHELSRENYIYISKQEVLDQYIGHTFAENERHHWPALYCYSKGETLYATYQLCMWDDAEASVPTIRYENGVAVAFYNEEELPFAGNQKWLKATPWAQWILTRPYFHVFWDKPMIQRPPIELKSWWLIFRVPAKLILLVIFLFLELVWLTVICQPLLILIVLLIPLRFPLYFVSNAALDALFILAAIAGCYFFLPFLVFNHSTFMTIIIIALILGISISTGLMMESLRCEQCKRYNTYRIDRKELVRTEKSTREEEEFDEESSLKAGVKMWKTYTITTEQDYENHYCTCIKCGHQKVFLDQTAEKRTDKKMTGLKYSHTPYPEVPIDRPSRSSSSSSSSSSPEPKEKRNGLGEKVEQQESRICGHCCYWKDGNCTRHDRMSVDFNAYACEQWSP